MPRLARLLAALLTTVPAAAQAGAPEKPWRLGVLFWHDSPNDEAAFAGMRDALAARGRPHELIVRQADEDVARVAAILDELERSGVDLVFAMGTQAALLAAERLRTTPVVFTAVTNPVESRVVPSWDGSGRNLAGNSNWIAPETVLHVFRLAVPGLRKIGMLRSTRSGVVSAAELRGVRRHLAGEAVGHSGALPLEILERVVDEPGDLAAAVAALADSGVQAIWIPIDFVIYQHTDRVLKAAAAHRLPIVSSSLQGTRSGALAGIVVDYRMLGKRAVVIALDVLEGGKPPGSLAIGTMKGYQVVVNLAAARRVGYEIPLPLLVVADAILEEIEDGDAGSAASGPGNATRK